MAEKLNKRSTFVERILNWHRNNRRNFPWRETSDPFAKLIAEILLQKTPAERVLPVFIKLNSKFPTPHELSKAGLSEVEDLVGALGLKKRAIYLLKSAKTIVDKFNGKVPDNLNDLLKLPGVGLYTASAVLCFAFNRDLPIVDSNIARILTRVFALNISSKRPQLDKSLWEFAAKLIPKGMGPRFNEALIDFAALICKSKPRCFKCPLLDICEYALKTKKQKNPIKNNEK